jgi:hypothetical protein
LGEKGRYTVNRRRKEKEKTTKKKDIKTRPVLKGFKDSLKSYRKVEIIFQAIKSLIFT